jgi:shikimate kinase
MTVPIQQRNRRIYIAGFMASGKSTVGPILANALGFDFVDLDADVAAREGKTVREIFRDHGEAYFRQREREAVAALSRREHVVTSLGGGTLLDPGAMETITTTGILVYLKVPAEIVVRRLRNKTDRPMVLGSDGERLNEEQLRERITTLLAQREPLYARADLTVLADEQRLGLTVDRLVHELSPMIR